MISVFSSEKLYVSRHSETRRKVSVVCYWSCAFTFIVGAVVVAILIGSKDPGFALIGRAITLLSSHWLRARPALFCHKEPAQDTQSPLLGAFLAFRWFFMA